MSSTFLKIKNLVSVGNVKISEHGYDELVNDNLTAREIIGGVENATLVEDYPDYPKGATVLLLQLDKRNQPIHAVWGMPKGNESPAVLITAYRPDPKLWDSTFKRRKK